MSIMNSLFFRDPFESILVPFFKNWFYFTYRVGVTERGKRVSPMWYHWSWYRLKRHCCRPGMPAGDGDARWGTNAEAEAVAGTKWKKRKERRMMKKRKGRRTAWPSLLRPRDRRDGDGDPAGPSIHLTTEEGSEHKGANPG